jgi:hypothetical protein
LHLEKLVGVLADAAAVQDQDGVVDSACRVEAVDVFDDAVLAAAKRVAGAGAEESVDDTAVGVVDDGDGDGVVVGELHVVGEDDAGAVEVGVGTGDVLGERATLGEGEVGGGDVPGGGSGGDHGVGLRVGDVGGECAGIGEVERRCREEDDGSAGAGGVEGCSGVPAWAAGVGG